MRISQEVGDNLRMADREHQEWMQNHKKQRDLAKEMRATRKRDAKPVPEESGPSPRREESGGGYDPTRGF